MTSSIAIVALTERGGALAHRIASLLPNARVHGFCARVTAPDVEFAELVNHLQALFRGGHPIIGVCACGILIRALALVLGDKRSEPPVIALAEDGSTVVPLLGGHRGANELSAQVAEFLKVPAAITTSADRRFGVALDSPPAGWRLANSQHYKSFVGELLAGASVRLEGKADWLLESALPVADDGGLSIRCTESIVTGSASELIYHSARLAIGVGCERGTDPAELRDLVKKTLGHNALAPQAAAGIFSLDLKMDEPAVHSVANELGVPARFFDAVTLEAQTPRLANPSELVFREVGCHGVAEASALAAAGHDGELIIPKTKSKRATCAIARAAEILDLSVIGHARGVLYVIGLGPGSSVSRTPEVTAAIESATHLVGYRLYLELIGSVAEAKVSLPYELGDEEARVRKALELAAAGHTVALVCSGDPGIYAMATLVFECMEAGERPDWHRVDVQVLPGISALQVAAARSGAPLGHDFCAISLSDLLTPWPVIRKRLQAAAEADFVIALYNPVSRRRTRQLEEAVVILQLERAPGTPVVVAKNLGRDGEHVEVIRLDELRPERVDMLTTVLIGSRETRRVARGDGGVWVYTPRGYHSRQPVPATAGKR